RSVVRQVAAGFAAVAVNGRTARTASTARATFARIMYPSDDRLPVLDCPRLPFPVVADRGCKSVNDRTVGTCSNQAHAGRTRSCSGERILACRVALAREGGANATRLHDVSTVSALRSRPSPQEEPSEECPEREQACE